MQQVGRVMRQQGSGVMVNLISSLGQGQIHKGHAAPLASQAGVIGLTRAAALELSAYHIRVNSVFRGPKDIDLIPSQDLNITTYYRWLETLPNVGQGEYHNLVSLVLFLCSNAAFSLTGQVISDNLGTL
jgi:3-oxoacyl-[acyl-carrier protein] reductase